MNAASEFPHVLVVDDNLDAAEVLALLIETEGYIASTACTLAAAREQMVARRPDIVLLDLNLPDGSGMSLLADIKSDVATSGIRVIVLSGMLEEAVKEQAHGLGAADFLLKPFEHGQLTDVLQRARLAP